MRIRSVEVPNAALTKATVCPTVTYRCKLMSRLPQCGWCTREFKVASKEGLLVCLSHVLKQFEPRQESQVSVTGLSHIANDQYVTGSSAIVLSWLSLGNSDGVPGGSLIGMSCSRADCDDVHADLVLTSCRECMWKQSTCHQIWSPCRAYAGCSGQCKQHTPLKLKSAHASFPDKTS